MKATAELVSIFAGSRLPILILGPSGTGKTELARVIHGLYDTARSTTTPFKELPCTAVDEETLVSTAFGHKKGSYTTAYADRVGFFEEASTGPIFLDEIGHVSLKFQRLLLDVIQTGRFRRLGENKDRTSNARIVAATWADLSALVASGRFDEGLLGRLSVVVVHIPPLKERKKDVIPTAHAILAKHCDGKMLSECAKDELSHHDWPDNARELANVLVRAHRLSALQSEIGPEDIRKALGMPGIRPSSIGHSQVSEFLDGSRAANSQASKPSVPVANARNQTVNSIKPSDELKVKEKLKEYDTAAQALLNGGKKVTIFRIAAALQVTRQAISVYVTQHEAIIAALLKHPSNKDEWGALRSLSTFRKLAR